MLSGISLANGQQSTEPIRRRSGAKNADNNQAS